MTGSVSSRSSYFLVVYGKRGRKEPVLERYEDGEEAAARRLELEAQLHDDPDRGVVLLYTEDEASLRLTHGSYFLDFDKLLERLGKRSACRAKVVSRLGGLLRGPSSGTWPHSVSSLKCQSGTSS